MSSINDKIKDNKSIINDFDIEKQITLDIRIIDLRNIKKLIKKKWDQLLNLL